MSLARGGRIARDALVSTDQLPQEWDFSDSCGKLEKSDPELKNTHLSEF
jgi:hypothetical protein